MMRLRRLSQEEGFTITEMMVVVLILSLLMGVFYSFLFGGERAARDGRNSLELNQTARLAMERLSRELREADQIISVSNPDGATRVKFQADFNSDGAFVDGVFIPTITPDERVTYEYDSSTESLLVSTDAFVTGTAIADSVSSFRFSYFGSEPRLDCDGDGEITWEEIDHSPDCPGIAGFGNDNGILDVELPFITSIVIEMTVSMRAQSHDYRTAVELRNNFK